MIRKFKSIILLMSFMVVLSACGAANSNNTNSTATEAPTVSEIGEGSEAGGEPPDGGPGGGGPGGGSVDTSSFVTDVASVITKDITADTSACSSEETSSDKVACLATAFISTLSGTDQEAVIYDFTSENAAKWSNLPASAAERNGLLLGSLTEESIDSLKALAAEALSGTGYQTLQSLIMADEYLTTDTGNTMWDADLYYIAFLGEPSTDSEWMLQIGGHHYAANITYNGTTASATPMFVGVEPQTFTTDGVTYEPLETRRAAMYTMIQSLSEDQLSAATIANSFDDVLVGPGQDGNFPSSEGVLVSSLTEEQQELVKTAIKAWVNDTNEEISTELLEAYLSEEALSQTYVGWSGSTDSAVHGSYIRIDGPRVWIEFVCQTGVAYTDQIHFHTIWRDKTADYGGSFSS